MTRISTFRSFPVCRRILIPRVSRLPFPVEHRTNMEWCQVSHPSSIMSFRIQAQLRKLLGIYFKKIAKNNHLDAPANHTSRFVPFTSHGDKRIMHACGLESASGHVIRIKFVSFARLVSSWRVKCVNNNYAWVVNWLCRSMQQIKGSFGPQPRQRKPVYTRHNTPPVLTHGECMPDTACQAWMGSHAIQLTCICTRWRTSHIRASICIDLHAPLMFTVSRSRS